MYRNYQRSLSSYVMAGAETGASVGRCITGLAGAVTGGLAGAAVGCFHWLAAKPLACLNLLKKSEPFEENE